MATLSIPDAFVVQITGGDKSSLTFNSHADLILNNPARKSTGRALVTGGNGLLIVNYANDFKAGVLVRGQVRLPDLKAPPPGVATDRGVADANGNLYKVD